MQSLSTCRDPVGLLSHVLGCVHQGVLLCEPQGVVSYANRTASQMLGYHNGGLVGRELKEIFTPEDHAYFYPNLLRLAARGHDFQGEIMLRRADDSRFMAYLSLAVCQPAGVRRPVVVISLEDIDDRKSLEKLLGKTRYQDLVAIANSIAHELRNPLVGIGGFVRRLYSNCQVSLQGDRYYQYIVVNLKRIEALVKKVEDLVSLPAPVFTRHLLAPLVEEAAEPYRPEVEAKQVRLEMNLPAVELLVDREQMVKAFTILLDNALKAVGEGGSITVRGVVEDNTYRVEFADDGVGIAPEDLPFIFNPFFSTRPEGIGIDLAVLKRIMEGHHGRVSVESSPGKGAAFTLELPLERRRRIRVAPLDL